MLTAPPFLSADALAALVPMADAIELVADAMQMLSRDEVVSPQRWLQQMGPDIKLGLMPGALAGRDRFGVKVLALSDSAVRAGFPSHQGLMIIFDAESAQPVCLADGNALTTLRTAAASGVATRALARPESEVLAIIGCGQLAKAHVAAIRSVRPLQEVRLWNRTPAKAAALAAELEGIRTVVSASVQDAVAGADIICTLTSSNLPVLRGEWLEPGQHVNLVGSSTATPREVDDEAVRRSLFFCDSTEHARAQAGELLHAVAVGAVAETHIIGEIGDVLDACLAGRKSASDITIYKSLGHIAQDLVVGNAAIARWRPDTARAVAAEAAAHAS